MRSRPRAVVAALAVTLASLTAMPAHGAGFGIFEQGTKAMGMAGAFTAQADDPSALFHNPGGIVFQDERDFALGFTWIRSLEAEFQGSEAGFPGPGVQAEQETLSEFPPHAYWVQPMSANWTFGLGVTTPFGLTTSWEDPPSFPGRFISHFASLTAIDVNPTFGWQATENLGIAVGAVGRFSTVELERDVPQFNPFTQTIADVATLELDGGFDNQGYGWNAGILHRVGRVSWGLSYRSEITVDYEGDSRLTQNLTNTPFDALIAARLPFGTEFPVETTIDFPDMASFGLAYRFSPIFLAEVDVNRTGWSSFEELAIVFPDGQLPSSTIPERYDDANNYRLGLRLDTSLENQWRAGVVFDESPQPEGAVSPLLPDSDRTGFTVGWGHHGDRFDFDLALMYLIFDDRTRDENFIVDGVEDTASTFFGTYNTEAVLLGLTLGF